MNRLAPILPGRPTTYDVVVVGARVAGASTAMLLARQGLRVLLLDRGVEGADTLSTHALLRTGVLQLHRWGILDRVVAAGTPPVRRTVFRYGDDVVRVTTKPAHGVDALYAPRRTVIDPLLVEAAREAGAEIRFGVSVQGVVRDGTGRVVGVSVRGAGGAVSTVGARWTVGADGIRSRIAAGVGAPVLQRAPAAAAVLYAHVPDVETEGYEWLYRTGVAAGLIPTNGGETCVFAAAAPARVAGHSVGERSQALLALLAEASPEAAARVAAGGRPVAVRLFPGVPGYIRGSWGAGWALVGDAGYFKDPLTAHGMSDALRDAELLARAIGAARRGEQSEAEAFGGYQARRDGLSARLFAVTMRIASFAWDTTSIPDLLLELSSSMTDEVEHLVGLEVSVPAR